jgi:molybdopterin converting factor small subunit
MKIKMDESRVLEFKIDTSSGCALEDLQGYLRFNLAGVEYGFPAKIEEGQFKVEVPAFQNVVNAKLTESISKNKELIVKGRLDVIANKNTYVVPWQGEIDIEIPIEMNVSEGKEILKKKKLTVDDPDKGNLMDAFNEIFEDKEKKVDESSKLKDILNVKVDEKKEEDKKWAYGTKDKKWHLIGKDDRDYKSAISQEEFKKLGKEKAKKKYLGDSFVKDEKKSKFALSLLEE